MLGMYRKNLDIVDIASALFCAVVFVAFVGGFVRYSMYVNRQVEVLSAGYHVECEENAPCGLVLNR